MRCYYVYIMTNRTKTLYTGVTNDLERRVLEHKNKLVECFTKKYNISKLVYFEDTDDVRIAIMREKQIKGWLRKKKIALIETVNPEWRDLSEEFLGSVEYQKKYNEILRCAQNDKNKNYNKIIK